MKGPCKRVSGPHVFRFITCREVFQSFPIQAESVAIELNSLPVDPDISISTRPRVSSQAGSLLISVRRPPQWVHLSCAPQRRQGDRVPRASGPRDTGQVRAIFRLSVRARLWSGHRVPVVCLLAPGQAQESCNMPTVLCRIRVFALRWFVKVFAVTDLEKRSG